MNELRRTASGLAYEIVDAVPPGTDQLGSWCVPGGWSAGDPLLLYMRGTGGAAHEFCNPYWDQVRDAVLEAGCLVAQSAACRDEHTGDDNWGNDCGRMAYRALHRETARRFMHGPTLLLGRSMGGVCAAYAATRDPEIAPRVRAVALSAAVLNLRFQYHADVRDHARVIANAFGVAPDGSDFDERTADHDPVRFDPAVWNGVRLRCYVAAADTTVPPGPNADTLLEQARPLATECGMVAFEGARHTDPPTYEIAEDLLRFFARALEGDGPSP